MVCALIGSSSWLQIANTLALPVSTTHSIIGGVIGVGIAAFGVDAIVWWSPDGELGFGSIALSWVISPLASGLVAVIIYGLTRTLVLRTKNSFWRAVYFAPFFYALVCAVLVSFIVYKGSGKLALEKSDEGDIALASCLAAVFGGILAAIYVSWWNVRVAWTRPTKAGFDTTHLTSDKPLGAVPGPAASSAPVDVDVESKGAVDPAAAGAGVEEGTFSGASTATGASKTVDVVITTADAPATTTKSSLFARLTQVEAANVTQADIDKLNDTKDAFPEVMAAAMAQADALGFVVRQKTEAELVSAEYKNIFLHGIWIDRLCCPFRAFLCHGICGAGGEEREVRMYGLKNNKGLHENVERFDDRTEVFFRSLQGLTSCLASFAHGSNDVANAIGPFSVIYGVYSSGLFQTKYPVETWMLAFGGAAISLGFLIYGYHLMRSMGNELVYMSASRGYCMEFAAALTVLVASKLGIPVSTTQCIVGSTVGVGMMSGIKSVNWKRTTQVFMIWCVTVPLVGLWSGLLFAFIAYSPTLRSPGA